MNKIDIVLIKANNQKRLFQDLSKGYSAIEPPLWLILNAAYLREKGFSVAVIDAEAENLDEHETSQRVIAYKPLLASVVVSGTNPNASTCNMTGCGKLIRVLKKAEPDLLTALTGLHPSALPERTLLEEEVDFVFVGEGFSTHENLLKALQKNKSKEQNFIIEGLWYRRGNEIISNHRPQNVQDLGSLPMPAWDLLPMDLYRAHNWHCFSHLDQRSPYAVIYTSLGCPFHCSFCCINEIFGGPGIRYRPADKVLAEIDFLVSKYKIKNIKVLDELFAMNWKHVEAICDGLISRGYDLNFWVYGRIDTVKAHMLPKMKKAGINWIAYGIEAGSQKVREDVSKGKFDLDQVRDIVKMTHEAGIEVVSNFIFGLPEDDMETMQATLDLAKELNCAYANFYCAMAYPGSQLYNEAVAGGVPLPKNWSAYSQLSKDCLPLPTKHLTSGQVLKFRDDAFDNYYTDPRYLERMKSLYGEKTVHHVLKMCEKKLQRDNY